MAKRLGKSVATVRWREGVERFPTLDEDGTHRFDPAEVELLAARMGRELRPHWPWLRAELARRAEADVAPTLLTPPVNGSNAYHEFAHFRGDGWVYTSIGRDGLGADLWRMKPDGSRQERVTFFGGTYSLAAMAFAQVTGFPEPSYSIVGGMAAVPGAFIAGVIHDNNATNIDAWRIDIVDR